jgi:hypothetical protein
VLGGDYEATSTNSATEEAWDGEPVLPQSLDVKLDGLVHVPAGLLEGLPVATHPGRSGAYAE